MAQVTGKEKVVDIETARRRRQQERADRAISNADPLAKALFKPALEAWLKAGNGKSGNDGAA